MDTAAAAVEATDLVTLCAPVGAMETIAREIAPDLEPGAIVSDVGSVKVSIIKAVAPHLPATVHFVPSHPVAGTEQSGPEAGFSTLFFNRWSILTSPEGTNSKAVAKLASFRTGAGAYVEIMQPAHHDLVLAITSHVPHLIAYNIVGTAADLEEVTRSEVEQNFPPVGFAILPASPLRIRRCGAIFSSTTRRRCSKCSAASTRI